MWAIEDTNGVWDQAQKDLTDALHRAADEWRISMGNMDQELSAFDFEQTIK